MVIISIVLIVTIKWHYTIWESSVLVELAKALHTTPNYLLLGDVEADDWMDDMIQMLEKIKRPEMKELAKKQIALLVQFGDS